MTTRLIAADKRRTIQIVLDDKFPFFSIEVYPDRSLSRFFHRECSENGPRIIRLYRRIRRRGNVNINI